MKNSIVKISFILCALLAVCSQLSAQKDVNTKRTTTSVYAEFGGLATLYSVNVEPKFAITPAHQVGIRAGYAYGLLSEWNRFPLLVTYNYRMGQHKESSIELGAGMTYVRVPPFENKKFNTSNPSFTIAYVYQDKNGFLFKTSFAVRDYHFLNNIFGDYWVLPAMSCGYTF